MDKIDLEKNASAKDLKKSEKLNGIKVGGYDFSKGVNFEEILDSFGSMGFQATNFSRAVEIVNKMIDEKVFIFLGYTSNMVSSGLRDVFRYLVQSKKVNVIVTTCGGIEEDIMKCLGDFIIGDFNASGNDLYDKGINRIGNIFVPNEEYVKFESFIQPILQEMYDSIDAENGEHRVINASDLIWKLGEKIDDERSVLYWAWKNKIRVYCPAITDGAIGGNLYFFKFKHPEFVVDVVEDSKRLNDTTVGLEKSGVIILGSGVVKHSILQANLFRNGADYSVYINTAQEYDGSDAGANPDEAVSWGKLKGKGESVKVFGDATILFPLLVAKSFVKE